MKLVNMLILTFFFFKDVYLGGYVNHLCSDTLTEGISTPDFTKKLHFLLFHLSRWFWFCLLRLCDISGPVPQLNRSAWLDQAEVRPCTFFTPALILFIGAAVSNSWTTEVLRDPATRTRYKKSLEMNERISEFNLNCCVMWFPVWPF